MRNLDIDTAINEARGNYVASRIKSAEYFQKAQSVMPGGNTRTVLHFDPFPFTVVKGEKAAIWDADGHIYKDFLGEYTAGLYGHNNPLIEEAIKNALHEGLTLGGPNLIEAKFAKIMCERFNAIERIRFCNSGTEANILALSAARAFTKRNEVVVVEGSYHGGVLTYSGDSPLNLPFPTHRITYNKEDEAIKKIEQLGDSLAAVLVEPMIGAGGCIPANRKFLESLRKATQINGTILIFDEVMTSRLTAGGLMGFQKLMPDLATFGKYLGGGLTFGAFGGRADIMDHFDPKRNNSWGHAGTFNNNILSMSAGFTGISKVFTPKVSDEFFITGNLFRESLKNDVSSLKLPIHITGLGSMIAFHFTKSLPSFPYNLDSKQKVLLELIHLDMLEKGQFYARRGMINISLPMTKNDLKSFRFAFLETLEDRTPIIKSVLR